MDRSVIRKQHGDIECGAISIAEPRISLRSIRATRPATRSALEEECGRGSRSRTKKILIRLSAVGPASRIFIQGGIFSMERFIEGSGTVVVTVDNTTVDVARAIQALSDTDLVRLKALARLWARGLPARLG
jgi:hypothetical protein